MTQQTTNRQDTFHLARQPILDRHGKVFGYELLYRGAADDTACTISPDTAGARLLTAAILGVGLETISDGRLAFLNLSRALLTSGVITQLPPRGVVLELLESIVIDAEVTDICRSLHAAGYTLALDDFVPDSGAELLIPYAKFVKVDVLATPPAEQVAVAQRLKRAGVRLVAEKVETREVFEATRQAGYTLFQGYYFCRPTTRRTAALSARHIASLQLLCAINKPGLTVAELENLVKRDVSLTYRVLRCVNSAGFGVRRDIKSIRDALVLLGIAPIRSWASVWCLAQLNTGGVSELVTLSVIRGRCCEQLAGHLPVRDRDSELFLVGMCSLLDTMLGCAMREALAGLPLGRDTVDALLGSPNTARAVLEATVAYERGSWDEARAATEAAGLSMPVLAEAYTRGLKWARELSQAE